MYLVGKLFFGIFRFTQFSPNILSIKYKWQNFKIKMEIQPTEIGLQPNTSSPPPSPQQMQMEANPENVEEGNEPLKPSAPLSPHQLAVPHDEVLTKAKKRRLRKKILKKHFKSGTYTRRTGNE